MRRNLLFLTSAIILLCSIDMEAQTIGISGSKMWGDNPEIEEPWGINLLLKTGIFKNAQIQFEYSYYSYEKDYVGHLGSGFFNEPQIEENINSLVYLHSIEILMRYNLFNGKYVNTGISGGFLVIELNRDVEGRQTGKTSNYKDARFGLAAAVYAETAKPILGPFHLFLSGKIRAVSESFAISTEGYTPLRENITFQSIQIGVICSFW